MPGQSYEDWGGNQSHVNLKSRDIIVEGEIEEWSPGLLLRGIRSLVHDRADAPITIHLNSPGGGLWSALSMWSMIRACPVHITVQVWCECSSAAVPVWQGGDKRLIVPHGVVMMHQAHLSAEGDRTSVERWMVANRQLEHHMFTVLLERLRVKDRSWTLSKLKQKCKSDWVLTAEEAVEIGLADGFIPFYEP